METDVVVVGAGPVGLALAGDLGWRGHRVAVLERGDGSIYQPRMDLVGIRTMEFCRRWGIVADVEASPYPRDYPQDNVYLTSLNGYELGREPFPSMGDDRPPPFSPQKRERCPQNMFDPILKRFASSFPSVFIHYGHEFSRFEQDEEGVTVTARRRTNGEEQLFRARYVVGCDGARSQVGSQIGAGYDGSGVLTHTTNVIFRTDDFNALHDKKPGYRYIFIGTEGVWATIVAINGRDQWRMSIVGNVVPRTYNEEEVRQTAVAALGRPFEFEVLSVVPWKRTEWVAPVYQDRRAFIAGDAAHVMSPTGGFGMNTGIGDAIDLSWKIDAVIEGWAGEGLLDSYGIERRPVAIRNVTEATGNLKRMLSAGCNPDLLDDSEAGAASRKRVGEDFSRAMRNEWYTHHIHLGYRYVDSPVIAGESSGVIDGQDLEQPGSRSFEQRSCPGNRAPHVWLPDGSSTLDLFGRGFVLINTGRNVSAANDLADSAHAASIPLKIVNLPPGELAESYPKSMTLVRPDGHVAWTGDGPPTDPIALWRKLTGWCTNVGGQTVEHSAQTLQTQTEGRG